MRYNTKNYVEVYSSSSTIDLSQELYEQMKADLFPAHAMEVLSTQCMWMRFNALADTLCRLAAEGDLLSGIGNSLHSDIGWSIVNRLLRLPTSEYDFNAFDPIHSLSEFKDAMEHCSSSSISGVWHIGYCAICQQAFGLEYNMVMEFERRGIALPKHCAEHMGETYINRVMQLPVKSIYNSFNPVTDNRRSIAYRNTKRLAVS